MFPAACWPLGSHCGLLLTPAVQQTEVYVSVIKMSRHSDTLLIFSVRPAFFKEVGWLGCQTMTDRAAPSPSSWMHIFHIYFIARMPSKCSAVICTHAKYCAPARCSRGIPPLWLFLSVLPFLFPWLEWRLCIIVNCNIFFSALSIQSVDTWGSTDFTV